MCKSKKKKKKSTFKKEEWHSGFQGLGSRRNGEMLIKGYKLSIIRWTNSRDLMYSMKGNGSITNLIVTILYNADIYIKQLNSIPWKNCISYIVNLGYLKILSVKLIKYHAA